MDALRVLRVSHWRNAPNTIWISLLVATCFGLTNVFVHILTAYPLDELIERHWLDIVYSKSFGTALAFGVVSFSITSCLLEVLTRECAEIAMVEPEAIPRICSLYIIGLAAIFISAHFELVYLSNTERVRTGISTLPREFPLFPFTIISSLGLLIAIFAQKHIEKRVLRVYQHSQHRYPKQFAHMEERSRELTLLVKISLGISIAKMIAKFTGHYESAVLPLVAVDLYVVMLAISTTPQHSPNPNTKNPFTKLLGKRHVG